MVTEKIPADKILTPLPGARERMNDPDFWRDLAAQFRGLGTLRGDWTQTAGSGTPRHWSLAGAPDSVRLRFISLAKRAALRLPQFGNTDLLTIWLDAVREEFHDDSTGSGYQKRHGVQMHDTSGSISRIGERSANLCVMLESQALELQAIAVNEVVTLPEPTVTKVSASASEHPLVRESRKTTKPARRNSKYEKIDKALREISAARPKSHEEVFGFLDDRKVVLPNRKPFKAAGGWLKGFQQNRNEASAWLSLAWGRLDLPAFARGPKK